MRCCSGVLGCIDFGVEDLVLKDAIYRRIMQFFVKKLDAQTRLREPGA